MNEENLFVYEEDAFCELRYTYRDLKKFERKAKKCNQLQSKWNSLREWLEEQIKLNVDGIKSYSGYQCKEVLDKMNELEGNDIE